MAAGRPRARREIFLVAAIALVVMALLLGVLLGLLLQSNPASAGSLKDIEHVVIFMQENRSWNTVCIAILYMHCPRSGVQH